MSENSRPDPPPYTPPIAPAPNAHTRVRTALAELLARPGLPNLFIFSLANLVFATGRGGAKICRPAPSPAGVLAHNSRPAPPRRLIRGPAIEYRG